MKNLVFYSLLIATVLACSIEPQPIDYGSDMCEFCHMTIVDKQHAAEIVTQKGRVYKFDAIECMMNYRKSIDDSTVKYYLINDYIEPGELVDATESTYLISEKIPSPMGAFLSGTVSHTEAVKLKNEHGGTLYTWRELIHYFKDTEGVINGG